MKKYFIFTMSVATDNNKNFAGQTQKAIYGKDCELLAMWGDHAEATYSVKYPWRNDLIEYGYNRECDAKRGFAYKHPENNENWRTTVQIVSYDF